MADELIGEHRCVGFDFDKVYGNGRDLRQDNTAKWVGEREIDSAKNKIDASSIGLEMLDKSGSIDQYGLFSKFSVLCIFILRWAIRPYFSDCHLRTDVLHVHWVDFIVHDGWLLMFSSSALAQEPMKGEWFQFKKLLLQLKAPWFLMYSESICQLSDTYWAFIMHSFQKTCIRVTWSLSIEKHRIGRTQRVDLNKLISLNQGQDHVTCHQELRLLLVNLVAFAA